MPPFTPTEIAQLLLAGETRARKTRRPPATPAANRGTRNGNARLTWAQVRAIRSAYQRRSVTGATYDGLAIRYGVSRSGIRRIVTYEVWIE